jgi:dipeptidase E
LSPKLLIVSTSKIYGSAYLGYLLEEVVQFFAGVNELLFIPYARPGGISYEAYTQMPKEVLAPLGIAVKGIHEFKNPSQALAKAQGVFTGGGNTFLLLKTLYEQNLLDPLRAAIQNGVPYMGSSAGSNIAGISIGTSNDMPIVYPPSFQALGVLPFNINPHYLDPLPNNKHQGETRETRIHEFHQQNSLPVLGLREGSWLQVANAKLNLKGEQTARLFEANKRPREIAPGDCSFLLKV